MEELRDIKGLVEIPDYSLYILIVIGIFLLVLLFFLFKNIKFSKRKKSLNPRLLAKEKLNNLNLEDSKGSSYELSEALYILELEVEYKELLQKLEKYKYKKRVEKFSYEEKEMIKKIRIQYGS